MKNTMITVFCVLVGLGRLLEDKREGYSRARPSARAEKASPPAPPTSAEVVSPQALFAAFEQNEVAADDRYKGKWIEVSGQVNDIGKDILNSK